MSGCLDDGLCRECRGVADDLSGRSHEVRSGLFHGGRGAQNGGNDQSDRMLGRRTGRDKSRDEHAPAKSRMSGMADCLGSVISTITFLLV